VGCNFFAKNRNNGPVSSYVWLQSFENGCCFQGLGFSLNNGLFEDQNKRNGHPHKLSLVSILCVYMCELSIWLPFRDSSLLVATPNMLGIYTSMASTKSLLVCWRLH
jgi:hypothetical protein